MAALRLTGWPWGPICGSRGASSASRRSGPTVSPMVTAVRAPAAAATVQSKPRRVRPAWGSSAEAASTGSAADNAGRRLGRRRARRAITHLAPRWAKRAPMVTQAIQKWAAGKPKCHGYHWAILATPENTMKIPPATRGKMPMRSTRSRTRRTGGKDRNRGQTTHSLASSTGNEAMPHATCIPWDTRNNPVGREGTGSQDRGCC